MAEPIIYVVDDDEGARASLEFLLDCAGLPVRGFKSADDFLAAAPPLDNACIITDVRMPGMNGVELVTLLKSRGIAAPVIMITGHADVPMAIQAMKAGVSDFIEKPFADDALLSAVRSAIRSQADQEEIEREREDIRRRLAALSPREQDVLKGLAAGHANKVIAYDLGISARTVEVYRANLMMKMGAKSLSEVIRMTTIAGLPR